MTYRFILLHFSLIFVFNVLLSQGQSVKAKYGKIGNYKGKPTIFVNEKPMAPIFYSLTHVYGGRWSWEEIPSRNIKNFANAGIRLFQVDLYFEDIWYKDKENLDIAKAQRQVKGVLNMCPDANVVIRIHVNAPFWWNEENKDEATQFADGSLDQREYGAPFNNEDGDTDRPLRASLASEKYNKLAGTKLAEFCKQLAGTPEGNSVIGIHVSGGVFGEWHYWGYPNHDADTGPVMTNHFRKWLKNKYKTDYGLQKAWANNKYNLNNASVPDTIERLYTSNGNFRDPAKERRVIDYFTCQQEVVADDIEYYCKIVKDSWPRPLIVGIFYGYLHMTFSRQASGGHLFIERILNSPYIDYLSAPQSYFWMSSNVGGAGHSRGVIESTLLHNKLFLDEVDNGRLQQYDIEYKKSEFFNVADPTNYIDTKYIPVIRRSAVSPLTKGIGLWYYDFGPRFSSGWWDNPTLLKNIKEEKVFFEKNNEHERISQADVLFVYDQESFYYLYNKWTPVSDDLIDKAVAESYKSGAVIDHIYLFDLDKVNLKQYKVIAFMNTYKLTQKQKDFIKNNVAKDNRRLIFNYMPGYTDGENLNEKFVSNVTEMKLEPFKYNEKPVVEIKAKGFPEVSYNFMAPVNPLMVIKDANTIPLGFLKGTDKVIVAKKESKDHNIIYGTLPIHDPSFFRELFRTAGVHIYNEVNEVTYSGCGVLWVHSVSGGERILKLKNGKTIKVSIEPYSTTLFDSETGNKIF